MTTSVGDSNLQTAKKHSHLSTSHAVYTTSLMPVKMLVLELFLVVAVSCVEILYIYFDLSGFVNILSLDKFYFKKKFVLFQRLAERKSSSVA